jgi:hypothetical protein
MKDKAISIRQPWASLIVAGIKDIENRSTLKNFRGPCWIHAAKTIDKEGFLWMKAQLDPAIYSNLEFPTGGIIGQVEFYDCVTSSASIWFRGPFGFLLRHPMRIDFFPCPGRLGFFDVEVPF